MHRKMGAPVFETDVPRRSSYFNFLAVSAVGKICSIFGKIDMVVDTHAET